MRGGEDQGDGKMGRCSCLWVMFVIGLGTRDILFSLGISVRQ